MEIISREEAKAKGLKRYFTGEPCIRGHYSERLVSNKVCFSCLYEKRKKKREEFLKQNFAGGKYAPKGDPNTIVFGPFISRELAKDKGLKQFYDGIPCIRGHYSKRSVINKQCFQCSHEKYIPQGLLNLVCKECGKDFQHLRKNTLFCSKKCAKKNWDNDPKNQESIKNARLKEKENTDWKEKYQKLKAKVEANPELKLKRKEWSKNANKKWWKKNPKKAGEYSMKYYNENIEYRVKHNLRIVVSSAIKRGLAKKSKTTLKLLNCTTKELLTHLESNFKDGMTWDNYSKKGWHVDHIRPCESFNLQNEEEQIVCFNWRNLQPLWASENHQKLDKYTKEDEEVWIKRMRDLGFEGELFTLY